MTQKIAIIIGAGPAGLTAAYELLDKTDIKPIIYEMTPHIGGLAKTENYRGNRIDVGGHRFFSKSSRVMEWWRNILPLQGAPAGDDLKLGREVPLSTECFRKKLHSRSIERCRPPDPEIEDRVMLLRKRVSRILFMQKLFDYPVALNATLILSLGFRRMTRIGLSYAHSMLFPRKSEASLEDFFINRFGKDLYETFFKDYTEKVWGMQCSEIKAEWGAQRIKSLSVLRTVAHAVKRLIWPDSSIEQKGVDTSLIHQFMYPKLGPGQLWEEVARMIGENGGEVHVRHRVVGIRNQEDRIGNVTVRDEATGRLFTRQGDFVFSTMPVKELIESFENQVPEEVSQVASGLMYRDFMTVGLLLGRLKLKGDSGDALIPDNWIYVQEPDVKLGRIQIFNNWSPYLVSDQSKVWIGLEYFCNEDDELWAKADQEVIDFAVGELVRINVADRHDVLDATVIRMPKTYPVYAGTYERFNVVREYLDAFDNLFLIGRNGMHRYNNSDHSMLTAMVAVENILARKKDKENIWSVNMEQDYHEEK